ncbi:MAG: S9 family peptidase [Acidobacteriota bacterium]
MKSRVCIPCLSSALLAAALVGCASEPPAEPVPAQVEVPSYSIQDFLDITSYRGGAFSPDGEKILVSSDESGIVNAYALPVDGSEPVTLTSSTEESIFARAYFPNDERFVYTADAGGNELDHVFVQEPDGTVHDLTPGEDLKAMFAGFTHDDEQMIVISNERDPRFFDVYLVELDGYERTMIYQNDDGFFYGDLSPDESLLLLSRVNTNADTDMFLHDLKSGVTTLLTEDEGDVQYGIVGFDPAGENIVYSTDRDSEFQYLERRPVGGGDNEVLLQPDWDVMYAGFSESGRHMVVGINNDARTEVQVLDTETFEPIELPALPNAEITGLSLSKDETRMLFWASSPRTPRDLYVFDFGDDAPRRLTRSLSERIDAEHLVEPEVVRFESFDGLEIPGILYMPHLAQAEGAQLPAVVMVHGGPGGQSRLGWNALNQYLANHGYVVYAINNRGSSGYGKTFFHLDDRNHGKGDLSDCVESKTMLVDTGVVHPDKIAIAGGSYGGYMVLAALTFRPEEFTAGVNIFGVSNWLRTTQSIPPWWEAARKSLEQELGDFDDVEYLRSISPLFHADNIVRPLLVLQGANDPRVLQAESDDIVEAARANGVPVEYIVFEDEGHGFLKKENREEGYEAILRFLDQYVKSSAPSSSAEAA